MPCPIATLKFVGTISLGLLTGVSYNLTTLTIPSLQHLPSAATARHTLSVIQASSTRHVLTLASVSSLSLLSSFWLASPRGKHPYLLYTALVAFFGGQGVEWWFNGLSRFPGVKGASERQVRGKRRAGSQIEDEMEQGGIINGETVERDMIRERWMQTVRMGISGLGFLMGVVGIWGDGA